MSNLIIEAGKFYKTKGGSKARIYAIDGAQDGESQQPIHGAWLCGDEWFVMVWCEDGSQPHKLEDEFSLVGPWIDPPVVDWDRLPPGILAVAIDSGGEEYGFLTADVSSTEYEWLANAPQIYIGSLSLWYHRLPDGTIKFSGDWRDSLVIRPGHEALK